MEWNLGYILSYNKKNGCIKNKHNDNTYPFKALTEWGVSNIFFPSS